MTRNPSPGRKRLHPARRARRVAGWLSVVAMAALTGCMAAATKSPTASTARSTPTTTSSPPVSSDDDPIWTTRPAYSAAIAGNASSQPVTASHAS